MLEGALAYFATQYHGKDKKLLKLWQTLNERYTFYQSTAVIKEKDDKYISKKYFIS